MAAPAFLAVDWGSTNRRVYAIEPDGAVVTTESDDRGILAMPDGDFASDVAGIRARHGDLPVLCAGMVGSDRGWTAVPYGACPADFGTLSAGLVWVEPGRTAIVPGVSTVKGTRGDVMRGEEVQFLGAVTAGLAPGNALFCQPGSHCKWAQMVDGAIGDFRTTMTGELFALLRGHGLLSETIGGDVSLGAAFEAGLAAANEGGLLGELFGLRASALLGLRADADAASFASGLIIGSDIREQRLVHGATVHLLASGHLRALYCPAIEASGAKVVAIDSHIAFAAGMTNIWRRFHATAS